jgi:hypothetical protein
LSAQPNVREAVSELIKLLQNARVTGVCAAVSDGSTGTGASGVVHTLLFALLSRMSHDPSPLLRPKSHFTEKQLWQSTTELPALTLSLVTAVARAPATVSALPAVVSHALHSTASASANVLPVRMQWAVMQLLTAWHLVADAHVKAPASMCALIFLSIYFDVAFFFFSRNHQTHLCCFLRLRRAFEVLHSANGVCGGSE